MRKIIASLAVSTSLLLNVVPFVTTAEEADKTRSYNTPEELIDILVADDEEFSNGGFIYPGDYSYDAVLNAGFNQCVDYLIVYGFDGGEKIPKILKLNTEEYMYASNADYAEVYSGLAYSLVSDNIVTDNFIHVIFFTKNTLPGWSMEMELISACELYGFDIAPYIYEELTTGDIDHNGVIDGVDASAVLRAYAGLSVGKNLHLNSTLFDCNKDGAIDANDASMILTYYSKRSVGENMSWEEFAELYINKN